MCWGVSSTISLIFMKNTLYLCVRGTAMRSPLNKLELGYFNWNDREWSDRAKFEILASRGPPSIRQKSWRPYDLLWRSKGQKRGEAHVFIFLEYFCRFFYITFTFIHLADAFIQSDFHCIQVTVLHLTSSCFPWESNP